MATEEKKADDNRKQVTVCGGGNGSHAFVVTIAASLSPRFKVNWLSLYADEADRINQALAENEGGLTALFKQENVKVDSKPNIVSKDPSKVIPGSDIIVLCVPAFAHVQYLKAINEHHEICSNNNNNNKPLIIAAFPSASGLEFAVAKHINNYKKTILFNCLTLPWACRILKYGSLVELLGIKLEIDNNMLLADNNLFNDSLKQLQSLFLDNIPILKCDSNIHILSSTLGTINPVVHCAIMYDRWKNYNNEEFIDKPLFYQGITQDGAKLMSDLSDEVTNIGNKLNEISKNLDELKNKNIKEIKFPQIKDWYMESYGKNCTKTDTLYGLITTNPGYNGLTHPMMQSSNDKKKWVPNWKYRYLTEDVPFGLIVTKAISSMLDDDKNWVDTPNMDKILLWCEKVMNKKYLKQNKNNNRLIVDLESKDIKQTRIPQNFGLKTVKDILDL